MTAKPFVPQPGSNPFLLPKQQLFDIMLDHVRWQGKASLTPWAKVYPPSACVDAGQMRCAYRGDGGLKCAVGALIPDDQYFSGMEAYGLTKIIESLGIYGQANEDLSYFLGRAQQYLHDQPWRSTLDRGGEFLVYVEQGARELAALFGLSYTPPEKVDA